MMLLNNAYCQHIGVEFMYNTSLEIRQWIKRKFEEPEMFESMHSPDVKKLILSRLLNAHCFEEFVNLKWPSEKQYGAAGCEILIPALQTLIDYGSSFGAQSFVLGN